MPSLCLGELARAVPEARLIGDPAQLVTDLTYDSRRAGPGSLFVCVRGLRVDGHLFLEDAVNRGAVAACVSRPVSPPPGISLIHVPDSREALGRLADRFFGEPTRRLRVIGVTGTNGKSTTTYLIKSLLETAGERVGLIGTIQHWIGDQPLPTERTTPEAADLQALFARMVAAGVRYAVLEVSSHGVALRRTVGTRFDAGVFTNISRDHMDFHSTFEEYLAAKARFFGEIRGKDGARQYAVVNADDPHSPVIQQAAAHLPVYTFGVESQGADLRAEGLRVTPEGVDFTLKADGGQGRLPACSVPARLRLTGAFNVLNALAAAAVGLAEGLAPETVARGLEALHGVPGRFERVDLGQPFTVIVDYAHTPDGLANVLRTARTLAPRRVIVVFGCGGDRDRTKRPEMGRIAATLADRVIITSDNPRSEDPLAICREIEAGVREARMARNRYTVVTDRREAIRLAVREARPGDLVLVAGKGHEPYQIFADQVVPFDDRVEARRALEEEWQDALGSR